MQRNFADGQVDCTKVNLAKKIDACAKDAGYVSGCYMQCLTVKKYEEAIKSCSEGKSYMVGCIPTNCVTIKKADIDGGKEGAVSAIASSVASQCSSEKSDKYMYEMAEAIKAGKASYKFCCGVNKLGAVIGGVIAAVIVLAVVGVFLWMYLAKKWLFAPKNKAQIAESAANQDNGDNEANAAPAVAY